MMAQRNIGVLALQGAVEAHLSHLEQLGATLRRVRLPDDLSGLDGLILPGGESTTLLRLMDAYGLKDPLVAFAQRHPVWGICAGAILLAQHVEQPAQDSLKLLPITLQRNAYGRQNESFMAQLTLNLPGQAPQTIEGVFIRAPRISHLAPEVTVLARHQDDPVAVQYHHLLVSTFHPELSPSLALHRHFLALCQQQSLSASA